MTESSKLEQLEQGSTGRSAVWFVLLFVLGWLTLLGGDWYFRFVRYNWQAGFVSYPIGPPARVDVERPLFATNWVSASRGGDLSNLLGIQSVAEQFVENRPEFERVTDRYGFQNRPYGSEASPEIVVVGDSFMATGTPDTQFASQLEDASGLFVYNHALQGLGPFVSLYRFLDDSRFRENPPRLLIWGFAEREIGGHAFAGMVYQLNARLRGREEAQDGDEFAFNRPQFHWRALQSSKLQTSLPNSSIIAQIGEWLWNRTRYLLFRKLTPEIVVSAPWMEGNRMLFFRYHIEVIQGDQEPYRMYQVEWGFETLKRFLDERGVPLLVVLIPEKEQVYRAAIPRHLNVPDAAQDPSVLWTVEEQLHSLGIPVVNLLRPFQEKANQGFLLYWRDDTHWNPAGVQLGVEHVWHRASGLLNDSDRIADLDK